MKKVIIAAVLVVAAVFWLAHKKAQEHSDIQTALKDYTYSTCDGWGPCVERLDAFFGTCFQESYEFSLQPGGDAIRLRTFVDCVNGESTADVFVVTTEDGAQMPFPVSR